MSKHKKDQLKFLLVDDDPAALQTVADYLKSFGYLDLILAQNADAAIEILQKEKINFVISDWEMPGKTGFELLRMLKNDEKFKHIPFIMVTSPVSEEKRKIEQAAGALVDGYVIKPFRAQVLREKIDHALATADLKDVVKNKTAALVVEDDKTVRTTIVNYLKQMGYTPVYEADNGELGLKLLEQHLADIAFIVSDWEMPKLSGIELLRAIRENVNLKHTPFIMVTSQTSIEMVKLKQALEADVDNYLLKPFRINDLKKKVEDVLTRNKLQEKVKYDIVRANENLIAKKWENAIKYFRKVIAQDPSNIRAYLGMALAQVGLDPAKTVPTATQYIRKAIAINPQSEEAHLALAQAFENVMSLERAIACLYEALKYCAFSEKIHCNLGRLLIKRGHASQAMTELLKALELSPGYIEAEELMTEVLSLTKK